MKADCAYFIFAILFAVVSLTASCSRGERADAIEVQLKEKIKDGISIGASRTEVESFVDSLEIESRKFTRYGYERDISDSELALRAELRKLTKPIPPEIKGYFRAGMREVDSDYRNFLTIDMQLEFYFDENERLVDYLVYQLKHP